MKNIVIAVLSILITIPSYGSGSLTNPANKIVFIAGFDEDDNTYYANARQYFVANDYRVVDGLLSLDEIIDWLNINSIASDKWDELHIVCHGNPWRGLSLKTNKNGERVKVKSIMDAIEDKKISSPEDFLSCSPKVILHSCGVGSNPELMKSIGNLFASNDQLEVYSTPYFNLFGGKHNEHSLAAVHYGFYKTAYFPGRNKLARQFEDRYDHTDIDWNQALQNEAPSEAGEAYMYKFNVPVEWTFDFAHDFEVPELKGDYAILDYVVQQEDLMEELESMDIDLEYFRWRAVKKDKSLIIKAKVTVVCILSTIMDEKTKDKAKVVSISDPELYIKVS